jgi:2-keto-4-pentenoate hydratase/2-oxohepta-3-ene-1,7-dioic acid hydratase in catechol pathway
MGDLKVVTQEDKGIQKRPELTSRSQEPLTLLDTSLCPDDITFVPNIQDNEEMHFELELVVVTRAIDKTNLTSVEALSYIVGYTLAVTTSVHPLEKATSEPGPGHHREFLCHSAVLVSDKT